MAIGLNGALQIANSDADSVYDVSTGAMPFNVGQQAIDADGNEYIFARGNTGIKKGSLVTLTNTPHGGVFNVMNSATITGNTVIANESVKTAKSGVKLLVAGDVGAVAVAMGYGTQVADAVTKYGWFKVRGEATVQALASAANAAAYTSATAGSITNTVVAANKIAGMKFTFAGAYNNGIATATDGAVAPSNLHRVELVFPYVG
jgi:hypothetical protein